MLDSNACVQCIRRRGNPLVRSRLATHLTAEIVLCSVVVGELRYGAERSANPAREHALIDAFVAPYDSIPHDDVTAGVYAAIRRTLEARGERIGPYDLQIAAIAIAQNLILVTHNTKEFSRVPGLILEDWEIP
jgi:tRNA(fMet)-specific endonuclease VapC